MERPTAIPVPKDNAAASGFAAGTLILAPDGPVLIEELCPGALVMTRHHGPQPLRAVERHPGDTQAVTIAPEAFGPGLPWRHLRLPASQRVLMSGWKSELLYGVDEALISIGDLISDGTILACKRICAAPTYRLTFATAQVIWAEGIEVEVPAAAVLTARAIRHGARKLLQDAMQPPAT